MAQHDVRREDSGLTMRDGSSPRGESPLSKLIQLHQRFAESGRPDAELVESQLYKLGEMSAGPMMIDPPLKERIHPFKDRIQDLEDGLGSLRSKQASISGDFKDLQVRVLDDFCPRIDHLSKLVGQETDRRTAQVTSLTARLDAIERLCQDASRQHGKLSELVETLMQAHDRFADETKQRYLHQMPFMERLDAIETAVGSAFDAHSNELGSMKSTLEVLEKQTEEACTSMEAKTSDLERHLALVEAAVGDVANRQTRQLEFVQSSHARLVDEAKAREKRHAELEGMLGQHLKAGQSASSLGERLDRLEATAQRSATAEAAHDALAARIDQLTRALDDAVARSSGDGAASAEKIRRLQGELEAEVEARKRAVADVSDRCLAAAEGRVQKLSEELFSLSSANARLTSDLQSCRRPLEEAADSAQKRIEELEDRVRHLPPAAAGAGAFERRGEEGARLARLEEALAALRAELGGLRSQAEERHNAMGEALAKGMREVQVGTDEVRGAMKRLEGDVPARTQGLRQPLQQRLDEVDSALREAEVRRLRDAEELRGKLDAIEAARAAENCSIRDSIVQATVEDEKRWQKVLEQLSVERTAKDKHYEHVVALIDQEREARARQLVATPVFRDLNEALRQRVDDLHRSVHALESLFRRDIQDRAQESASLWGAIDAHQLEQRRAVEGSRSGAVRSVAGAHDQLEGGRSGTVRSVAGGDDAGGLRERRPQYKGHALMSFITQEGYGAGPDAPEDASPKRLCEQLQRLKALEPLQPEGAGAEPER